MNSSVYGAAIRRAERAFADVWRSVRGLGSASPMLELVGDVTRSDLAAWNRATARGHDLARSALPIAAGSVAVVCVSMRPHLVRSVADHVAAQRHGGLAEDFEVIFVANGPGFERDAIDAAFSGTEHVCVIEPREPMPLGAALNRAISATDARFVAKFDDDDRYGPHYLADSLRAHAHAGAGVVGKHSYYAHLVASDRHVLRYPGNEYRYSSALAGGTLVIDRERTGDLAFEEISLGEDQAFIRACHRRGISTYSADRFSFVQVRAADNTWPVSDARFADGSIEFDESFEHEVMR